MARSFLAKILFDHLLCRGAKQRIHSRETLPRQFTSSALADSDGRLGGDGPATSAGPDDSLASFSNFGADVDIAAPGVNTLSTVLGGYARGSGTSVASPHVAGAAALYLADNRGASPADVKAHLLSTRKDVVLPNDPDGTNEGVLHVGDKNRKKHRR